MNKEISENLRETGYWYIKGCACSVVRRAGEIVYSGPDEDMPPEIREEVKDYMPLKLQTIRCPDAL